MMTATSDIARGSTLGWQMTHDGFRLDLEPWIDVQLIDGSSGQLSLRDAFHRAGEVRAIRGEVPTQAFAILRLMLAIMIRASQVEEGADQRDQWLRWWSQGLPLDVIDAYLEHFGERFDLFGERPFMQVADLEAVSGNAKGVETIILDLPSNNRLFTNRAGQGAVDLSFAEAARWLINTQAWDPSGIKTGAVGDPRVKGGRGYPIGVAWAGLLGGVYVEGESLRETLLLNFIPAGEGILQTDEDNDIPPWEEETPDSAAPRDGLVPSGPVRLYTWQARRIRLFRDGDRVIACIVANGDRLTPQNAFTWEPMTAWRFSEPQTKALKQTTYMPREHRPGRALWRGLSALLPGLTEHVSKHDVDASMQPAVVRWLGSVEELGVLAASTFRLRAVGVVYGSNNSVVDDLIDDEVVAPLTLLRARNRALAAQADEGVRLADQGVRLLRDLAQNLVRAAGGDGDGAKERAGRLAYAALDEPYRRWLAALRSSDDPQSAIAEWKGTARRVLEDLGAQLLADAGPSAWVGREVARLRGTELITTPRAESWFRRGLARTFGAPEREEVSA